MACKHFLKGFLLGFILMAVGCVTTTVRRDPYGYGYPPSSVYDPYNNRGYDPYDPYYGGGVYDPYYDPYGRSHRQEHRALEGAHQEQHEELERKYDKAMRRLDRQEHETKEKLNKKYEGNISDPRYQEQLRKTDQKYDYKRQKVERNLGKEHSEGHQEVEQEHGILTMSH